MQQLSEQDAAILADDSARTNANVSLLHIYDQSTAPGGKVRFKTLLAHIESRLGRSPVFRRKLVPVPLGLDRPYWVEDEHFDLEYHVRHIALPKPGDWRQFCIQVSRIHARALDLARPLWEIYIIEGLDSFLDLPEGSFALLAKTHHAAVDFERDSEWTMLLHDLSPQPAVAPPAPPWFPEREPGALPLLARGVLRSLVAPRRSAAPLLRGLRRHIALARAGQALLRPGEIPAVRFNAVVSPHRVFETRRFGLDEFERIRKLVRGATLHDAVLAVCGGALRRYLDGHDELPAPTLSAVLPVASPRGAGEGAEDEALSWQRIALATDLDDPVQRLRAIHRQTAAAAREAGIAAAAPAGGAAAAFARTARQLAAMLAGRRMPLAHCAITHLPGPEAPMYLCGARMSYFSAMLPIADGMGLSFAVTRYDGRVVISPTSCRELMPDPERFAQCLRDSFQELLARSGQTTQPSAKRGTRSGSAGRVRSPSGGPARPGGP